MVSPEVAETLALLEGVRLAIMFDWQQVILESDCLGLITAMNSTTPCLTAGGHLVDEIKTLRPFFSIVIFKHLYRSANFVAHNLAKQVDRDKDGT